MKKSRCECGRVKSKWLSLCDKCLEVQHKTYLEKVKQVNQKIKNGDTLLINTYLGPLPVLFLSANGEWAHTKNRSWAISSSEINKWLEGHNLA